MRHLYRWGLVVGLAVDRNSARIRHGVDRSTRTAAVGAAAMALAATSASAWEVRTGDTLSEIADATGTSVGALVRANDISDPDLILPGQHIRIPGRSSTASGAPPTSAGGAGGSSSAGLRTHVVQSGETPSGIANRWGMSVESFMRVNGLTDPRQLMAGALVRDRAPSMSAPVQRTARPTGATHTVQPGDTVLDIAIEHGVSTRALARANGLADANHIVVGRRLRIPARSSTGGSTTPSPTPTSSLACPVPGGSYVNDFGVAKPDGRHHEGIDIHAPTGTPVLAPADGMVTQLTGDRGGIQWRLVDDRGREHWGTHLDTAGLSGPVRAGDLLGTVGTTGNAIGGPPHLHYEVQVNDVPLNPYPFLEEHC